VAVDAAVQSGAERISVVVPTYPYSRQHMKKGREGLTASRIGQMLENLGVARIITLDIHSREIENCFNRLRLENLHASYQIIQKLATVVDVNCEDLVVLSPDTGAIDRNKFYASTLQKPLALLYKERDYSQVTKNAAETNITDIKLLGDVRDKIVFMADDMLGTGGTLLKAMQFLREQGARQVICAVSLPMFSADSIQDFEAAYRDGLFHRIIGTNAIHHDELLKKEWFLLADVSTLFAQVISLVYHNQSLSPMLDNRGLISRMLRRAHQAACPPQGNLFQG
ncbi:MAG TPA: ribose-phosphate diphosphokinase, partial [Magnetospirillaceae bacterium]|nr:ribose-phosphate diphosphokinase [Magnetospirillaceae bacterium]